MFIYFVYLMGSKGRRFIEITVSYAKPCQRSPGILDEKVAITISGKILSKF
jgi:hypothetical protein